MTVAARQLFKGVRPHDHISATALENPRNLNSGNFRDPPGSGFYALRCRVLGFNRNCIGFGFCFLLLL